MYNIKTYFYPFIKIVLITVIVVEFAGFIFAKIGIIPSGSPAVISLFADKNYGVWHPKDIKFKHHYNTCWDPSVVSFNNIGARSTKDYRLKKERKRIAILGDSMTEMIHVTDGEDIGSILQNELNDYEILNFSARSFGLAEQTEIYKKLIRKYKVDYLFLFVTENDIENNFSKDSKSYFAPNYFGFYVEEGNVVKRERNHKWFERYNSKINRLKRSKLILNLKDHSFTFKTYYHFKTILRQRKIIEKNQLTRADEYNETISNLSQKKIIYRFLINNFIKEIKKDELDLYVVFNLRSYLFEDLDSNDYSQLARKKHFELLKELWEPYNSYFPKKEAEEYIKKNKDKLINNFKFLGHTCDDHYSKFGSKFLANYTLSLIKQIND